MGREFEYKLSIKDEKILEEIICDAKVVELIESWKQTDMNTTYYDTADRLLSSQRITLRKRREGEKSIVCVKTPLNEPHLRNEWQIESDRVDEEAILQLVSLGAPKALVYFASACKLIPSCGAEFLRRHAMMTFSDGSRAEIACDRGLLHGQSEELHFAELELELYEGEPTQMISFVRYLRETYAIDEEPKSKHARARMLK